MQRVALALLAAAVLAGPAATAPRPHGSTIRVGGAPVAVAVGAGSVWVLVGNGQRARLLRLAPGDGRRRATVELGRDAEDFGGVAVGAGAVWVAAGAWLVRVDPAGNRVMARIRVGSTAISVFATRSAIWVTRVAARFGQLVRVDPTTNRVVARTPMGGGPGAVVAALGSVWVVNTSPSSVMRIDPRTSRVAATLLTDRASTSLAAADGRLWVAAMEPPATAPALVALDARGGIELHARLPRAVVGLASRYGRLWGIDNCACAATGHLFRLDARSGRVTATYRVGDTPVAVAVGDGAAWVANFGDGTVSRIPIA